MNWKLPAVLMAACVLTAATLPPADAAPRKRVAVKRVAYAPGTVFVSRDEDGRTRTRIIVQRRSYLDGGTEVLPGQRKFLDYAIPPYYSAYESALGPGKNFDRNPLNPLWENNGTRGGW